MSFKYSKTLTLISAEQVSIYPHVSPYLNTGTKYDFVIPVFTHKTRNECILLAAVSQKRYQIRVKDLMGEIIRILNVMLIFRTT